MLKFLKNLIPFFNDADNGLTDWLIVLLIIIFIGYGIFLFTSYFKIRAILKLDISENIKLKDLWLMYERTLFDYGQSNKKSTEPSENYFNEYSIIGKYVNLKGLNNVSNLLVGIGIFGTFLGLAYGITNNDFNSIEAIKKTIDTLLEGMKTAFITSIWGMGLSLIFSSGFKFWHYKVNKVIQ